MWIGFICKSLDLGMWIEVTTETLSNPFLISPTNLKIVPYFENSLFLLVQVSSQIYRSKRERRGI